MLSEFKPEAFLYQPKLTKQFQFFATFAVVFMALAIPISPTLTDISFIFSGILSLSFINWYRYFPRILEQSTLIAMLLLVFLFMVGLLYSPAPWHDRLTIIGKYSKLLVGILAIPLFANVKIKKAGVWAFFAAMTLTLLLSLLLHFHLLTETLNFQAEGVFRKHIDQNLLMSVFAYLLLIEMYHSKSLNWLFFSLFIITVHQIFFISGGRSGYITFLACLMLYSWQIFRFKGLIVMLLAVVMAIPVFYHFSTMLKERVHIGVTDIQAYHQGHDDTSLGLRMIFAKRALFLAKEKPILGHGTGSYSFLYQKTFPHTDAPSNNPHNEYLHLAVQFGIIGFALFLLFILAAWRDSFNLSTKQQVIVQAITLTFMIGCVANSWLMDMTPGHIWIFWLIWGLA